MDSVEERKSKPEGRAKDTRVDERKWMKEDNVEERSSCEGKDNGGTKEKA